MSKAKKLAEVPTSSLLVTEASMENTLRPLKIVLYIHHPLHLQKNLYKNRALINLDNKVNIMILAYTAKLGFKLQKINIRVQKIDGSILNTFEMVLKNFQIENKLGKAGFFRKTFLVADINLELILGILFLTFGNVDI